jgi:hypothetical protein
MDNSKREAYEKWIDRIRKLIISGMLVCFVGIALSEESILGDIMGVGAISFCVLGIALVFEYLIRLLLFRSGRKMAWYQFSLSGMLIFTACVAAVCSLLKIFGPGGIGWLIIGLVIFAWILEEWLRKRL